ncbi:MAG: hypothetical protein M0P19_07085 [Nevskia sp.]|jgi:hypothetical protein|nr:hypothetical protein [Nevskia sp.]MCK9385142.1 hypothetical protein [Nevskia sp.]
MNAAETLSAMVAVELATPLPAEVTAMAKELASHGGRYTVAVLFYGSVLRSGKLDDLLDFYVVVDSLRGWHQSRIPAAANRLLPPNVIYFEYTCKKQRLRAKVAVLRLDQFRARVAAGSLDTTIWARYSQPSALVWARDSSARSSVIDAVSQAIVSAASWAAHLGPESGAAEAYWQGLFQRTYGAELRVEKANRAETLTGFAQSRYATLLPLAWLVRGIENLSTDPALCQPNISAAARYRARAGWAVRRALGKPLNFARLVKNAYTFADGVDYLLWKIERHSGVKVELSPWQRRHPILAAPGVLWRLRRQGVVR